MPKGKKIYEDLSKKYTERREARKRRVEEKARDKDGKPIKPVTINNFKVNKPMMARSLNFSQAPVKLRSISKTEGRPVVNASFDVKRLIHKPKPIVRSPLDNPTAGVIKEESLSKKQKGRPSNSTKKKTRRGRNAKTNKGRT